jgi:endonuclease-3
LELAQKQLGKIKQLSGFVRNYTLQSVIGAHQLPIDESMARSLVWLGLVTPNQDAEQMGETLKAVVRKAEVPLSCFSIRCLATDKVVRDLFDPEKHPAPAEGHDGAAVTERLADLYKTATTKAKAKPVPKVEAKPAAKPAKAAPKAAAPAAAKKKAAPKAAPVKKVAKKAR